MEKLSSEETSHLTGTPPGTLRRLQQLRLIPSSGGLSRVQVLGIAVSRGLAARGCDQEKHADIFSLFMAMTQEELESCLARGERYVAVFGTKPEPNLIRMEDVTKNPGVQAGAAFMAGLLPALIDVQSVWENINRELAKLRAEVEDKEEAREKPAKVKA